MPVGSGRERLPTERVFVLDWDGLRPRAMAPYAAVGDAAIAPSLLNLERAAICAAVWTVSELSVLGGRRGLRLASHRAAQGTWILHRLLRDRPEPLGRLVGEPSRASSAESGCAYRPGYSRTMTCRSRCRGTGVRRGFGVPLACERSYSQDRAARLDQGVRPCPQGPSRFDSRHGNQSSLYVGRRAEAKSRKPDLPIQTTCQRAFSIRDGFSRRAGTEIARQTASESANSRWQT